MTVDRRVFPICHSGIGESGLFSKTAGNTCDHFVYNQNFINLCILFLMVTVYMMVTKGLGLCRVWTLPSGLSPFRSLQRRLSLWSTMLRLLPWAVCHRYKSLTTLPVENKKSSEKISSMSKLECMTQISSEITGVDMIDYRGGLRGDPEQGPMRPKSVRGVQDEADRPGLEAESSGRVICLMQGCVISQQGCAIIKMGLLWKVGGYKVLKVAFRCCSHLAQKAGKFDLHKNIPLLQLFSCFRKQQRNWRRSPRE